MPELKEEEIAEAVKSGKIGYIALDTSIFDANARDLEGGRLKLLSQFKESNVPFLMPDVVLGELKNHMRDHAEKTQREYDATLKDLASSWKLPAENVQNSTKVLMEGLDAAAMVDDRIDAFQKNTGYTLIAAKDYLDIGGLLAAYEARKPPFETNAKKKNEFPDAIALMSLEAYVKPSGKMALCVSKDKGWTDYAKGSQQLCSMEDLSTALSYFQADGVLKKLAAKLSPQTQAAIFFRKLRDGQLEEAVNETGRRLQEYAESQGADVEATSSFRYEYYTGEVTLENIVFQNQFSLVDSTDEEVTIEVTGSAAFKFYLEFNFYGWDSIDKEEFSIGSREIVPEYVKAFKALITVPLEEEDMEDVSVEITELDTHVEFGDIGPKHHDVFE